MQKNRPLLFSITSSSDTYPTIVFFLSLLTFSLLFIQINKM
ncbi:hypothetical protein HMPREF0027_2143 [Actinobacillus ureae ATCC 25976]|uniref:Uncharacterized protein n=1 Tax=Actinobacillus ureae ATCC 25976 TaxID=887324 RepID=E8KJW9_9PAST|nr:hypothetical protein HMPREF0027_2143 [Actinobacillus ureae ATCC 25976]